MGEILSGWVSKEFRDRSNRLDKAMRCNESHHPAVWRIDLGDNFQQHRQTVGVKTGSRFGRKIVGGKQVLWNLF